MVKIQEVLKGKKIKEVFLASPITLNSEEGTCWRAILKFEDDSKLTIDVAPFCNALQLKITPLQTQDSQVGE